MLKIYVDEKAHNAEIEVHGNLITLATDTTFAISKIYQEMLENGREGHAHEYRELLESGLSKAFDAVDRLHARKSIKDKQPPSEIQELLDEILKRRR